MKHLLVLVLAAGAVCAQTDAPAQPKPDLAAERHQAIALFNQGQALAALPLLEDLVAANPNDAATQGLLAYCLFVKSRSAGTEEAEALRKRVREGVARARELGSKWNGLDELTLVLNTPGAAAQPYSTIAEANAKMQEGEQAFGRGDNDGALAAYNAALKIDPKLYSAALFAGDVCFRRQDIACAAEWFGKAIAIDPARETAYRYWGDALVAANRMLAARDKYVEAIIAQPAQKLWAALVKWAQKNNCQLTAPKIDRPQANPSEAWAPYAATRAAWRESLFARNFPKETQYRHTLAEEMAALSAVADGPKAGAGDPQIANIVSLRNDGLLEAWILLSGGADEGIAKDYPTYSAAHHQELRAYFDKYIIHPASQPAPKE